MQGSERAARKKRKVFKGERQMKIFRIASIIAISALLSCGSVTTEASLVMVEPDAFPKGTNISKAFPGVTLSAVGGGYDAGPDIFSVDTSSSSSPFSPSTGGLVFGTDSSSYACVFRERGFLQLRADFSVGVSFVSVDFIGNNSSDFGELFAYDSDDNILDSAKTNEMTHNDVETLSVSSDMEDIAYILAGGDSIDSSVGIDNLQYVPEPATVLLLGLGGFALLRKRSR